MNDRVVHSKGDVVEWRAGRVLDGAVREDLC